jgi:hypothetical protein
MFKEYDIQIYKSINNVVVLEDVIGIQSKYMAIAEKEINENVCIRIYGYGNSEKEAEVNATINIMNYETKTK